MKKILTARVAMMILTLIAVLMIGCGEEEGEETAGSGVMDVVKETDNAPAAPQAPTVGVPFVSEVNFYHDWELMREVQESVSVGDTIFVKVVFSEPMKHVIAEDKWARPIFYYRRVEKDVERVRFRIAAHGAGGEDFVSGDAKPLRDGTDDYICKYTIVPEDEGKQIAFMIGKWSVDLENNTLSRSYTHKEKLRVKSAAPTKAEESKPVDPLTVVSITHYRAGSDEPILEGESVDEGTTIDTEIVFSMPVRANSVVISYPVGLGTKHLYQSTGVHWRESYQVSKNGTVVRSKLNASEEVFSLLVERAASLTGNILKQSVAAPEIPVIPRAQPIASVPQEPAVSAPQESVTPVSSVNQQRNRSSPLIVNGEFTAAAIEEYRAIHAKVNKVRESLGNTQDLSLLLRPHLVWRHYTGVEITAHESVYIDVIYRNQYPGRTKTQTAKQMEYLRIKLAHPEKTAEETLDIYAESVKSGIVDKIRADLLDEEWRTFFIK